MAQTGMAFLCFFFFGVGTVVGFIAGYREGMTDEKYKFDCLMSKVHDVVRHCVVLRDYSSSKDAVNVASGVIDILERK